MKPARRRGRGGGCVLAIDQGTTATKAVLVDAKLRIVAEVSKEFPQHFPRPGWVEHDVEEIWGSVRAAVAAVLRGAGVSGGEIAAIGIANQRETTALWDRETGRPIARAIVWQDRRTDDICRELRARGLEGLVRRATGLVIDPYFSGTKIAWLLRHVPGAARRARSGRLLFGTIDSYLAWRLSGGDAHVTDVSNASRTLLMDLSSGAWNEELLRELGVPRAILPEIRGHDEVFARTRGLGWLPDGIPIASLIGDQQAALFGQACLEAGEAKCTYGTGAFLVVQAGSRIPRSRRGLLATAAWKRGSQMRYALEGSTFIAGAAVQWLRDGLGIISRSSDVDELARRVSDSEGVVFVPALTGLGAPHWNPAARGAIRGLSRGTTAAHLARATLEGIAFQIRDLVEAVERDAGLALRELRADGGATASRVLMQFQADILGVPVLLSRYTSTTALGAAALAGLAVGFFSSEEEIRKSWRLRRVYRPRMGALERRRRVALWEEAVATLRPPGAKKSPRPR
ncbi:MAG: glycerol kinase GlpK [Planctomycetota bacterium]